MGAPALLSALPQHSGHDREEGRPQRAPPAPDLAAAHRIAARAREARARALEGGRGAAAAAASAARAVHEGDLGGQGLKLVMRAIQLRKVTRGLPWSFRGYSESWLA